MDKKTLFLIVSFLIFGGAVYGLTRYFTEPEIIVSKEHIEEAVDSTTTVLENRITRKDDIIDSVRTQSEALAERLERSRDEIASYNRINGELNLKIDSLEQETEEFDLSGLLITDEDTSEDISRVGLSEARFPDTTFVSSQTFGDDLFRVTGYMRFRDYKVSQTFDINQLRPIRLDVAVTVSEDRSQVRTFVSSNDFIKLDRTAVTEIKPRNKLPWGWIGLGVGFGLGIILN